MQTVNISDRQFLNTAILVRLNSSGVSKKELATPEVFEAVEAIIKAGEAASKLIYGEVK
jgi:hypothetical protein